MSADDKSLGEAATFAGQAKRRGPERDVSLGDERTVGGGDSAAVIDTRLDEIEVYHLDLVDERILTRCGAAERPLVAQAHL